MAHSYKNSQQFLFLFINLIIISMFVSFSTSLYDTRTSPPKLVKEVCERSGQNLTQFCLDFYNTGGMADADLKMFTYYTRDFTENNVTEALEKIDNKLIPYQYDSYVREVLNCCKDAFSDLKDELVNNVTGMVVEEHKFREARALLIYGIGLMESCRLVCNAKPISVCPLEENINNTQGNLRLFVSVLELMTEGVM